MTILLEDYIHVYSKAQYVLCTYHSGSAVRIRAARIPAVITPDVKTAKRGYAVMVTLGRTIDILKRWHTDKSHACNEKLT